MAVLKCSCKDVQAGYSERYDARYCKACFAWLETACKDPSCGFCASRPPCASAEEKAAEAP